MDEQDDEPPTLPLYSIPLLILMSGTTTSVLFIFLLFLIFSSAMISGSEVAFFSLSPTDVKTLEEEEEPSSKRLLALREKPRTLLATILISNNLINIAIVVISYALINDLLDDSAFLSMGTSITTWIGDSLLTATQWGSLLNFLITVFGVTSVLLLFGEVAPKIYANVNNLSFAKSMSLPLSVLDRLFGPLSKVLVRWSSSLENRLNRNGTGSIYTTKEDLDAAIDLTVEKSSTSDEDVNILKSILKFGDTSVKQIMKPRVDVVAVDQNIDYVELIKIIRKEGYSRIPVFDEDFDKVTGILYVKDLLGTAAEGSDFKWQKRIRENVLYVPESKKIDDLLKEFQQMRLHMAIVVDEYGGSAGIVTLEDIMEEVIGDIKDEFDEEEEHDFIKIGDNNYIFEGKTLINDACRIIDCDPSDFDNYRGESDTLAGLILEREGILPKVDKEIVIEKYRFKIISVSNRRIEKINVLIQ